MLDTVLWVAEIAGLAILAVIGLAALVQLFAYAAGYGWSRGRARALRGAPRTPLRRPRTGQQSQATQFAVGHGITAEYPHLWVDPNEGKAAVLLNGETAAELTWAVR